MQVIIPYPGSTPEEVEQLITRPVEEALSTLAGIEELRSRSEAEQATFQIAFDWGRDIDAAAFDVRTKLDSIRSELPAGADRILAFSFNASDQPVVVVRISADQDLTDQYDALERYLQAAAGTRARRRPRRAAGRRAARGSHSDQCRADGCAQHRRAAARDAPAEEQLLRERRRDHRAGAALQHPPDRRVPLARRHPQPARHFLRCAWPTSPTSSSSHRSWRSAGISTTARPSAWTSSRRRRPTSSKSSTPRSRRSSAPRRCRSCRASASSSSATRPRASAIRSAICATQD